MKKSEVEFTVVARESDGFVTHITPDGGFVSEYLGKFEVHNFDESRCNHTWKTYIGFSQSYKYCTKCPEKRNLDEQ
jgi:hypothetical protein